MQTVNLKNGSTEAKPLVAATMLSLRFLLSDKERNGALAFYELVQKCNNPDHKIWSEAQSTLLMGLDLLDVNGDVHSLIKNVVLSAAQGEGLGLSLGSPYA
jgi:hypothetical protein